MLPEIQGYETLRKIGEGGVGAVYLARSRAEPERLFALKFLHEHTALREADLQRFLREGRVGQRLHHPHVLPVLAIEESVHGPVLVMDYVEGSTLSGLGGAEPGRDERLGEKLLILASIADALEHLHRHGVAHRDVKPANVLVRKDGHPFLIDFGFSRTLAVDSTITATGTLLGTPAYLAPELLRGGRSGDFRSDVYSLGVTAFEVATAQLPFAGDDLPTLFERILSAEPPALARLAPAAPRGLEVIVRRCLEKRPEDRYSSAAAVRDDLRRVAAGMRPRGGGASLWVNRELRRLRRERLRIAAVSAVLLLVLAIGLFFVLRATHARLQERELGDELAAGEVLLERGQLEPALAAYEAVAQRAPRSCAPFLARADAFAEFELWSRASAEVVAARALGYPSAERAASADELYHAAIVDYAARRYEAADAELGRALTLAPELYRAYFLSYQLRFFQGRVEEAKRTLEECRRNLKEVNPRHAVVVSFLQRLDSRYGEAIATLDELRSRLGSEAPAWLRRRLGEACLVAYLAGGRSAEHLRRAAEELEQAVALEPGDGNSWSNLGTAQLLGGDVEAAARSGEHALVCDPDNPGAHRLLATLDAQRHDWASGLRHLEQAENASAASREVPALRAEFVYQQAKELYDAGKPKECIAELERCLALDPEHLAARCFLAQAATLVEDGRLGTTEALRALELLERWKPRFATGLLPGEANGLSFQQRNRADVHVALVGSAGRLGTLTEDERRGVEASLAWLREHARPDTLGPATALNLARAVACAPAGLRDCDWAYELLDEFQLEQRFGNDPGGAATLRDVEKACQ